MSAKTLLSRARALIARDAFESKETCSHSLELLRALPYGARLDITSVGALQQELSSPPPSSHSRQRSLERERGASLQREDALAAHILHSTGCGAQGQSSTFRSSWRGVQVNVEGGVVQQQPEDTGGKEEEGGKVAGLGVSGGSTYRFRVSQSLPPATSYTTRVGMGLVSPPLSNPRPSVGKRSPTFSIPTSPRNKMWGGEVEEQMVSSILPQPASTQEVLRRCSTSTAPHPIATSRVAASVAASGKFLPGPGGAGGQLGPQQTFELQMSLARSKASARGIMGGKVKGDTFLPPSASRQGSQPFDTGNVTALGTTELAAVFSLQRGASREFRELRLYK